MGRTGLLVQGSTPHFYRYGASLQIVLTLRDFLLVQIRLSGFGAWIFMSWRWSNVGVTSYPAIPRLKRSLKKKSICKLDLFRSQIIQGILCDVIFQLPPLFHYHTKAMSSTCYEGICHPSQWVPPQLFTVNVMLEAAAAAILLPILLEKDARPPFQSLANIITHQVIHARKKIIDDNRSSDRERRRFHTLIPSNFLLRNSPISWLTAWGKFQGH